MLKDSCFCEDDNNGGGYVSPLRSEPPIQGVYMPAFLMTDAYFRNPAGDLRLMNGKCAMRLRESFGLTGLRLDLDQYKTVDIGIHMSFQIRGMYH